MSITPENIRAAVGTLALAASLLLPGQATAAPILTFSLSTGDAADLGSIVSYSFNGLETSIAKDVDSFTPIVTNAVASGTPIASASLVQYDGVVSPPTEVGRYHFEDVFFTSQSFGGGGLGGLETFTFLSSKVTFTPGPGASIPEPTTWLMLLTGACAVAARRVVGRRAARTD